MLKFDKMKRQFSPGSGGDVKHKLIKNRQKKSPNFVVSELITTNKLERPFKPVDSVSRQQKHDDHVTDRTKQNPKKHKIVSMKGKTGMEYEEIVPENERESEIGTSVKIKQKKLEHSILIEGDDSETRKKKNKKMKNDPYSEGSPGEIQYFSPNTGVNETPLSISKRKKKVKCNSEQQSVEFPADDSMCNGLLLSPKSKKMKNETHFGDIVSESAIGEVFKTPKLTKKNKKFRNVIEESVNMDDREGDGSPKSKKMKNETHSRDIVSESGNTDVGEVFKTPKLTKKNKKMRNDGDVEMHSIENQSESVNMNDNEEHESPNVERKKKNQKKSRNNNMEAPPINADSPENTRKEFIRQKLTEERTRKGLVMLSQKAEARIYRLKKALNKKGLPPEEIRQIVRQERRQEELHTRHSDQRVCFRCRKPGHRFADCKLVVQDTDQGAGVCFRCGSTEHILRDCTARSNKGKLPYAKCFVCRQQGHLSRECPSNPRGAFPRGGRCNVCGSVNHLRKDCPQLQSRDEESFTARVMQSGLSVDALDDE